LAETGLLLAGMIGWIGFDVSGLTLCLGTCYLLPMLYQLAVFVRHQGWKNALETCLDYPALLMMPTFSMWSFGASEKKSYCSCQKTSEIGVSFTVTFINSMITLGGIAITSVYLLQQLEVSEHLLENASNLEVLIILFIGPVIVSMILIGIVACLDNLSCCSCSCCCDCCLPMTERDSIFKTEKEDTNAILEMQTLEAVNQEAE
jgi:hypothetical protein